MPSLLFPPQPSLLPRSELFSLIPKETTKTSKRSRFNTSSPVVLPKPTLSTGQKASRNTIYSHGNKNSNKSEENFDDNNINDASPEDLVDRRCVDNLRMLTVDAVQSAKAGHPGMPLGMAEVGYVPYRHVMRYNPKHPKWFNRDRFVLIAGHEKIVTDGVEVTTGPRGQGVANAVGLALAEAHLAARFNKPDAVIVDHRTYCLMGDGCAMEGITLEAASLAAHWKLNKLTLFYDDNQNTIDGPTSLAFSEDISVRFKALCWNTITVDNLYDDIGTFKDALHSAFSETETPTFIKVKTVIGKLSEKEGTSRAHHGMFDEDDMTNMKEKVNWVREEQPFHVIPTVYRFEMQLQAERGEELEREWYSKLCLNQLAKVLPGLIGGSADLATANKAYLHDYQDFCQPDAPWGCNICYGVREHAMAGISNGIALHGSGLIPFTATFLVFSDYMKNSIRLSALSHAGVIYILTHDLIGLGEDGPTHQLVERLAGLRAVPRLLVFRPADGNETAEAYKIAIANRDSPSFIALSRQKVSPNLEGTSADKVDRGGYIVSDNSGKEMPKIILIGTGTQLPMEHKELVLPSSVRKRLRVEAGSPMSWREYVGDEGAVIATEKFGASGAY
ncbi:Transketolase, putative [Theobroma cacao]|uniref:transketolase n=1 Tax=Theobroma cacao TaxID=3641 RepID=A0A061FNR7_THECC|nr:Transketolase, putative [Theobroma cacao]